MEIERRHLPEKTMKEIKKVISDVETKYHTGNLSDSMNWCIAMYFLY